MFRSVRSDHKRNPTKDYPDAEHMAYDAVKATGTFMQGVKDRTRSNPVYPHALLCNAPRHFAKLGSTLPRASTQALKHNGKGIKVDLTGRFFKASTRPSAGATGTS